MTTPIIVGAGLAGLIAAHAWPQCPVVEVNSAPAERHKALLRFRNDSVAKLTGIEFRAVQVRKGIWANGAFREPTIALANAYSLKCLRQILPDRSIWNLAPAQRFVAPDDFYAQLIESVGPRIAWNTEFDFNGVDPVISTAPLPVTLEKLGVEHELLFDRAPIIVQRAHVPMCDAFQTVYFPGTDTALYRASLTGSTLIAEFAGEPERNWFEAQVQPAFCIPEAIFTDRRSHRQQYGKIAPVDNDARKELLFKLTHEHGVFSLGRFATWRNILLDDVVDDISVIKQLMRGSRYERRKVMA
jgi:hypothetical protein